MEQRRQGTLEIWAGPFTVLHAPKLFNLRADANERADIGSKGPTVISGFGPFVRKF